MKKIFLLNVMLIAGLTCLMNANAQFPCTFTCPANIFVGAAPNQCGANITYPATGTCGVRYSIPSGSFFRVGTTMVTATSASGTCTFSVTVADRQAPTITNVSAVPPSLWPPNHKMVPVRVNYTSADNCGVVACGLAVTSNEPVNSTGDGNTAPDWVIVDNRNVLLRAERKGNGTGRVYTIFITCRDAAGNATTVTTQVVVPHDMSGKTRSETGVGNVPTEQGIGSVMDVKVLSNPSRNAFSLNVQTMNKTDKINVKLFDLSGRMVESVNNLNPGELVSVGTQLRAGTYLAELKQGSQNVKVKLVKL